MNYVKQKGYTLIELFIVCVWLPVTLVSIAAWFTHVIHCIQNQEWFFLIAGAIAFPIAVVHGVGLWFGFF